MPETPTKPSSSPPSAAEEPEATGFLQRWSQRKTDAAAPADPQIPVDGAVLDAEDQTPPPTVEGEATDGAETAEAAPPVTEADLENLTYDSDYTKFMGKHVPEAIRRRALQQLWRSDPILANLDGLCDYDDDFTDAALAVKVLKTAHKVGQGYLTDEEVAANRARGTPPETADKDDIIDDDGEDMEDFDDDGDTGEADVPTESTADQAPDEAPVSDPASLATSVDVDTPPQTETS